MQQATLEWHKGTLEWYKATLKWLAFQMGPPVQCMLHRTIIQQPVYIRPGLLTVAEDAGNCLGAIHYTTRKKPHLAYDCASDVMQPWLPAGATQPDRLKAENCTASKQASANGDCGSSNANPSCEASILEYLIACIAHRRLLIGR